MLYDVAIEEMTPCGGEKYAIRSFAEVETNDPIAYVESIKRFPNLHHTTNTDGDLVVTASNPVGYRTRYTFSLIHK